MSVEIIRDYVASRMPGSAQEEAHLVRELLQELVLSGLARAGFFNRAAFHGGTSLRILHGLRRFSEDLDFILEEPSTTFDWTTFERALRAELAIYDVDVELQDRSGAGAVRALWLKSTSFGKILQLDHPLRPDQKMSVKLEIDTNPPAGSGFETRYVDFPVPFSLQAQDLSSGFANKLHALLCREYVKGRDWYDLIWYVGRHVQPNLVLLQNAIDQHGPWAGRQEQTDTTWLLAALREKVSSVDFSEAMRDVERFLGEVDRRGLEVWSSRFFLHQVDELERQLP